MFNKRKKADYFITVCVVMRIDDGRGMTVKRNDGGGWNSDGVMLWRGRRKDRDTVE
jgi:hypothetical protein